MAINFPDSPSVNDTHTVGDKTWTWDGTVWMVTNAVTSLEVIATVALVDADADTKIQLEESADEDKIRFDTAGSERLIIDASGNVGIGTTSPNTTLEVAGNAGALRLTGTDHVYQEFYADGTGGGRSGYVGYGNATDDDLRINNSITGGGLNFWTENSTRMTIDSSGNVGIGTTSPLGALDIHGNTESLIFSSPSNTNRYRIDANITDAADFGLSIGYWDGIASDYKRTITFDDSGKVGIGTTTPTQNLEIYDDGATYAKIFSGNSTGAAGITLHVDTDTTANDYWTIYQSNGTSHALRFYTGGIGDAVTFKTDGKVGIGTTSPGDMLDVGSSTNEGSFRVHAAQGSESFRVTGGVVRSANIVATTTNTAANMFINASNNSIYLSNSSIKYKTDVETMEDAYADAILDLRPVWFRSLGQDDPDTWSYWGFIAEEVAEIDPRLATFTVPADYERQYDEDGEPINPDVKDLTEPNGVQYSRIVPHLVNLVKRQRDQIADVTARIADVTARIEALETN